MERVGRNWLIRVDEENVLPAHSELVAYELENQLQVTDQVNISSLPQQPVEQNPLTILIMGLLVIFYVLSGPWNEQSPWFTNGAVSGHSILQQGEWWRVLTGLTLHADLVHLFGNLLIGGMLVHFLLLSTGNGIGLFLLMLTGTIGNTVNILMHGPLHNSVGFSTAIFGAIGAMTGMQCVRKGKIAVREIMLPLAGGAALLAILGSSGQNTDLGAHFWGMIAGLACGGLLELLPASEKFIRNKTIQRTTLLATVSTMIIAWRLAWQ
jgi:membrane associated rhomboid family serine protease